jgi:hypothetical protein
MQQGSGDGHDESSLLGMACNLNRHKAYRVSGSHNLAGLSEIPRIQIPETPGVHAA